MARHGIARTGDIGPPHHKRVGSDHGAEHAGYPLKDAEASLARSDGPDSELRSRTLLRRFAAYFPIKSEGASLKYSFAAEHKWNGFAGYTRR
jgi:hypothetical protein